MNYVSHIRNVNEALNNVMILVTNHGARKNNWRTVSPRGIETIEWKGVFITEYEKPDERVLFSNARDANPYFHFFEALWILAGREDVEFLAQFNPKMRDFSDDGVTFHAPYGHRLMTTQGFDQIDRAIHMLKKDHDTRQVVLQIWDASLDMNVKSKDIPCNDLIFLKIKDGGLNISVCCRSNDVIWGAYGANAVQFSTIQEFIARAVGVKIGTYTQISDSFHIYTANDAYQRLLKEPHCVDMYALMSDMRPFPLMDGRFNHTTWIKQLKWFIEDPIHCNDNPEQYDTYFSKVALPMWESWVQYKNKDYDKALKILEQGAAYDWSTAAQQWIVRRMRAKGISI
jgi:hypothetical protein